MPSVNIIITGEPGYPAEKMQECYREMEKVAYNYGYTCSGTLSVTMEKEKTVVIDNVVAVDKALAAGIGG